MSLEQDTKNIPSLLKSTQKDGGKLPRFTFKDLGKFSGEKDWDYQFSLFLHPTTEFNKKIQNYLRLISL